MKTLRNKNIPGEYAVVDDFWRGKDIANNYVAYSQENWEETADKIPFNTTPAKKQSHSAKSLQLKEFVEALKISIKNKGTATLHIDIDNTLVILFAEDRPFNENILDGSTRFVIPLHKLFF